MSKQVELKGEYLFVNTRYDYHKAKVIIVSSKGKESKVFIERKDEEG